MSTEGTRLGAAQAWVLALTSLGSFMVVLDLLVVATALTAIRQDLGASLQDLEWTVNAYTLSFAVLIMTATVLGDRFGRRRLYAAGLTLFALASAGCALAPNAGVLIAARLVQGAGAATVMPLALALLNQAFPTQRRGWALGVYGSVTGFAAVLGPILGGAVTQGLGWQWIFWLNVPIALGAVPLVFARIEESFGPPGALDPRGLLLVAGAALGVVWALVRGNAAGWGSPEILVSLVAGIGLAGAFVAWEVRAPAPMIPMRLFRSRAFSAGNVGIFCVNAALAGAIFLMTQLQQVAFGEGPLQAGLRLLPWGVVPVLLAPWAGSLADRIGVRRLVVAGLVLEAAGLAWLALVTAPGVAYVLLIAPMALVGVGFTIAIPALTKSVTSLTPPADLGKASGTYTTMRQLGGAFGVAILGATFAAAGSYASPQSFTSGFVPALGVAAAIAAAGAIAGALLPAGVAPKVTAAGRDREPAA
ncbi:MAG: DHA2 family efflux MFS transporter permease subunit [Candidatus Dormibacteraeota bacterium]|nr:DHA2 family efflux MFS transporter permease subunit [Candidatus Dormibacteraeota bacterium]MBO0761229.1 DHA2 family efflux MFS transporter permease subunit [Candidatus Dormibacteraeota bacterium]